MQRLPCQSHNRLSGRRLLSQANLGNASSFSTSAAVSNVPYQSGDKGWNLKEDELCIPESEAVRFMKECMQAVSTPEEHANRLALNLVAADLRGHFSHGLSRLAHYVTDVKAGTCDPTATPIVIKEGPATAVVDGKNGLGVVVGEYGMSLAIRKAETSGVGWVTCRGSNHFGICQWYTQMALDRGMVGVCATNTSPLVAPTRSKEGVFGTNPISIAAPGMDGDRFLLDMSTSAVAVGKIEIQMRKGLPLPSDGWAIRKEDGAPTTDPEEAFHRSVILPLGGQETNSGYKGYGLGMAVELLCGLMAGSNYANNIRLWTDHDEPANLGQCFIAVDPDRFAPGMRERLQELMGTLRRLPAIDPTLPVLIPGDPERRAERETRRAGFIRYTPDHIASYRKLAVELGVAPMEKFRQEKM